MIKRLFLLIILLIGLGGLAAYFLVPWNDVLQRQITAFLNTHGLQNVTFTIDKVGIHQATLNDVVVGANQAFKLQSVTVQYDPREVLNGQLRGLTLTGLDVDVRQTDEGWSIGGLEEFSKGTNPAKSKPVFADLIDVLPFSSVSITDSYLRVTGKSFQTVLPFNLTIEKSPEQSLSITINASNLNAGKSAVSLGIIKADLKPNDHRVWSGPWTVESITAGDLIPVLSGGGTISIGDEDITATGALADATKGYTASFHAGYNLADNNKSQLTVDQVIIPFQSGVITAGKVVVPFSGDEAIAVNTKIQKVSIDALLQKLTGERVSATGTVSGSVPIIVKRDGSFTLGKGSLQADGEGQIQMPGDVIPGDNQQVALVRQILEDLHYRVLTAAVETNGAQGMTVHLSLEGNNPNVYDGRPVKLNVNLTGDLLDFIRQNAMLITNPEKLLEQGTK